MNDKSAVALKYAAKKSPTVLATGTGKEADEMIALARELEIPLYENHELAALLCASNQQDQMPEWLEPVLTDVLAFALWLQGHAENPLYPHEKEINSDQQN